MLPTRDEMDALAVEARLRQIENTTKEEFRKGLISGLLIGYEGYRISPDGQVTFVTREEMIKLLGNEVD